MSVGTKAQTSRFQNTSLVLESVLSATAPVSRADIAASTGLTRATVSRLVDDLLGAGIVGELAPQVKTTGRPSLPLKPLDARYVAVGMEVNLNYLAVIAIDLGGNTIFSAVETGNYRESDPAAVLRRLGRFFGTWVKPEITQLVGVTLCIPGLVDPDRGTILTAPNLGWSEVRPAELLELELDVPLRLMNEADAAAHSVLFVRPGVLGEHESFLYISGEVGIGAAIAFNSLLFTGANRWAGEIGHMCIDPSGPRCGCGANGCLEQYAGQDAMLRAAKIPSSTTLDEFIEKFRQGSKSAREALDAASVSLGRAIASVLNLLDLNVVVLGGNLAQLLPHMEELLHDELKYRVLASRWSNIQLIRDESGHLSAAKGGCLATFRDFVSNPMPWLEG